jgi:haloacetate dehalogenase
MTGWFEHFEERRFALGGAEIAARLGGDPGKPALLLLHGFPQTHVMWHRVAQRLKARLLPGPARPARLRDSSHAPGLPDHSNYSKRALAQDFIEVMDTLGIAASPCAATTGAAAWRTGWHWTTRPACASSA